MPQCKFSLYLKKAGLASRNIVHFLKKSFYVVSVFALIIISIEHRVLCRLIRPAVLLHSAAPKMADKDDRDSSSETESDSGDRNDVKMQEMPLERNYICKISRLGGGGGGGIPHPLNRLAPSALKYTPYFPSKGVGISALAMSKVA